MTRKQETRKLSRGKRREGIKKQINEEKEEKEKRLYDQEENARNHSGVLGFRGENKDRRGNRGETKRGEG